MTKSIYPSFEKFFENNFLILPSLTILYWAIFQLYTTNDLKDFNGFIFGIFLAALAFVSGIFTFVRSIEWEFFKSYIGKSMFFISLALFSWGIGQVIFLLSSTHTNLENVYDYVFVLIDPFYLIGIYYISRSLNTFKDIISSYRVFFIPVFVFSVNLFFFSILRNEEVTNSFTNFDFNLLFILGSIILSTFVVSLLIISGKKIGGRFKSALYLILTALLLQYLADNLFEINDVFQTNGSLADLIFFLSILFVLYGVVKLNPRSLK